jgi:hypothetical protein
VSYLAVGLILGGIKMFVSQKSIFAGLRVALFGALLAFTPGCLGGSSSTQLEASFDHDAVVLKDYLGNELLLGTTEPYSPRKTCGDCHDFEHAELGYHFQQGRADETGDVVAIDDFFGDGRDYIVSSGMYGKW